VRERTDGAIIIGFERSLSRYILRNSLESVPPFVSESYEEGKKDCREGCWGRGMNLLSGSVGMKRKSVKKI